MVAVIALGGFLVSACKFVVGRSQIGPEAGLLAGTALLLAVEQLGRLSFAVVSANWLTPGDAPRAGAYGLLLVISVRLYRTSQAEKARAAIIAERQRIARDLHDGLAQDLAFIAAHSDRLAYQYGSEHPLTIAARRALRVSQGQIIDLEASRAPTTAAALREVGRELAARFGVEVVVVADAIAHDHSTADRRELVRIAREAIVNAVRHGRARHIAVTLGARGDDLLLRVTDDGCGFDAAAGETAGTGLGMRTMCSRARRLGARLRHQQSERGCTEVAVVALDGTAVSRDAR